MISMGRIASATWSARRAGSAEQEIEKPAGNLGKGNKEIHGCSEIFVHLEIDLVLKE